LFNTGVTAVFLCSAIGLLLGFFIMASALTLFPASSYATDIIAQFYGTIVFGEIAPLLVGIIIIGRSASAVTSELGYMKLNNEFEALQASHMNATTVFLLPVVIAFPLSLTLLFVCFNAVSVVSTYATMSVLQDTAIGFNQFVNAVVSQLTYAEVAAVFTKTLLGGLVISLISVHFGLRVNNRFTEISKSVSKSYTLQLFVFFSLNVGLTVWVYL
jgi:phospholipid/cholesterol/gamma-HCH transport system permease protein